jgi:predicted GNAT family acetyltransferase
MSTSDGTVTRHEGRHRFEITYEGEVVGFTTFREVDGVRVFLHTEIDPKVEGKGLGSKLVRSALDQTRADGMTVDPQCPFTRAFIERHPEYADLVAA